MTCCRKPWELKRKDRECNGHVPGVGNATFVRDPQSGGIWYSLDKTGHGGSAFKMFTQKGSSTLEWVADLDKFGDIMTKNKSEVGKIIDLKSLKCKDV